MTRLCCLSKISTFVLLFSIIFVATAFAVTPPPPPQPNVTFEASPTTIIMGESSTLTWTSVGESGTTVTTTIDNVEVTPGDGGNMIVSPTSTTPYNLSSTATNSDGTSDPATASVTVTVQYSITATTGTNGSISSSGISIFDSGANQTYTFTPNPGYRVADVIVDDISQGARDNYTFSNINRNHTIKVMFELIIYNISGTVTSSADGTPLANVNLSLEGTSYTAISDAAGVYSFTDIPAGTYNVIPSLQGYAFTPAQANISSGNVTGHNFTGIQQVYSISGTVTSSADGSALANVNLSLEGTSYTAITDAAGFYSFTNIPSGTYRVIPSLQGYTFSATTTDEANITTSDATGVDFTGSLVVYGITGTVTSSADGSSLANVTLALEGTSHTAITDAAGLYSFTGIPSGTYRVIPSLQGYIFSATTTDEANITTSDATGIDFTGSLVVYGITGTVTSSVDSTPIANVDMSLEGTSYTAKTDAAGAYSFTDIAPGTYNVVPSLIGYTFSPASTMTEISTSDAAGINFQASVAAVTTSITAASNSINEGESVTLTWTSTHADNVEIVPAIGAPIPLAANASYNVSPPVTTTYTITASNSRTGMSATDNITITVVPGYDISGSVTSSAGAGLENVTMSLSGATETITTTDSLGNYTFVTIPQGSYILSPSLTGYTFNSMQIEISQDLSGIDFQAMPPWSGIKQFGSDKEDDAWANHEDNYGNVYVAGKTLGGVGGNVNAGSYDIYLKKYNASGVSQWTVQIGSYGNDELGDYVFDITTDNLDNVLIVGQTKGEMGMTSFGGYDVFILKYDRDGQFLWAEQEGTNLDDYARGIAADSDNNIYITGYTYGDLTLTAIGNAGQQDAYLMKFNPEGVRQWVSQRGTSVGDEGSGVATSSDGHIYVTGFTEGALEGMPNEGHRDIFLSKYDSFGSILWTALLNSMEKESATGVTVTSSNEIYIGGYTYGSIVGTNINGADYLIAKYNSEGIEQWVRQGGSIENDMVMSISSFGTDEIYIAGYTEGDLGGSVSAGLKDAFIVKYNSMGDEQWIRMVGTDKNDYGCSITSSTAESVFISGYTMGHLDGSTNTSEGDAFLIKYNSSGDMLGELNVLDTFDGNNDGIYDVAQDNVASFQSYDDQDIITLETPDGTILSSTEATAVSQSTAPPANTEFPYGVFTFNIENVGIGGSTTATLTLPEGAAPTTYYKFGKTPADQTDHWYEFSYDLATGTGAKINGNIITLHFVDGLRGDNDLEANGVIEDPGAPGGIKTSTPTTPNEGGSETDGTESGGGSGGGGGCFIGSLL